MIISLANLMKKIKVTYNKDIPTNKEKYIVSKFYPQTSYLVSVQLG